MSAVSNDQAGFAKRRNSKRENSKGRKYLRARASPIHGTGVFATTAIPAETCLIEYEGKRISHDEADNRIPSDPANPFHTFFFGLEDGTLIDAGDGGNEARWINHSCNPNCEAREEDNRIFIYSLRDIHPGEELHYDYRINLPDEQTASLKKSYECRCGASNCRGTMLGDGPAVADKPFFFLDDQEGIIVKVYEGSGAAASLATILTYQYGIAVSEQEMATRLAALPSRRKTAEKPVSFSAMKQVVQPYGMTGVGYAHVSLAQLLELTPSIIQIKLVEAPHFTVFRGIFEEHAVLADPVYGNIALPLSAFLAAWEGQSAFFLTPPECGGGNRTRR